MFAKLWKWMFAEDERWQIVSMPDGVVLLVGVYRVYGYGGASMKMQQPMGTFASVAEAEAAMYRISARPDVRRYDDNGRLIE